MTNEVRALSREEIRRHLDDIAELRMTVFRAWPYLYEGDAEYERRYLRPYVESERAIVVGAFDGDTLIGASTGTPLADHDEGIGEAVARLGHAEDEVFYLAESVLLPSFRGRGIGHAFFDAREDHARTHGFRYGIFASVVRPEDHPRRPPDARDLGPFWRGRGYRRAEGAEGRLSWQDIGEDAETEKPLALWIRDLSDR